MSLTATLPFPSGRALAGWWKQLAPQEPRLWWVGHLYVHRVEAAVVLHEAPPLSSFHRLLLQSLALSGATTSPDRVPATTLKDLEDRLHLSGALLAQVLRQLNSLGWVDQGPDGRYGISPAGRTALDQGKAETIAHRRQTFSFLEQRDSAGSRFGTPCFLPLGSTAFARPWRGGDSFPFDPSWLKECVGRDVPWKEQHGFPVQVQSLLFPGNPNGKGDSLAGWQKVVVDRLEEVTLALIQSERHPERVLGFAVHPGNWQLDAAAPILNRSAEALPILHETMSPEVCRQAWNAWTRPRNLPQSDVDACQLNLQGCTLRVQAPPRLIDLLRQAKSDVFKGDAWVLLGDSYFRQAARLEVSAFY